ncbi:MAG: extracellular solute-binding protein [Anaerolineae bacterium]|nr:extracellular solute-binding protein [Anaerolineae bacterium]
MTPLNRSVSLLSILLIITLSLAACTGVAASSTSKSTEVVDAPGASQAPAGTSFLAEAAKPYQGIVLHGITENTSASNYVKDVLAPAFEEETGIKVEVETVPWADMYSKSIEDMEANSGIYDFVYIEQDIIYTFLEQDFLVNLTQMLQDNPELASPDFKPIDFTTFIEEFKDPATGDLYGVPMESFLKVYVYRQDLFEDPAIQEAFAAKYGYPLGPAVTFDQYRDIAAFFTQYGQDNDLELWGSTVQAVNDHPASFYEFFETIAPSFGVYNWGINLDNYKATVDNGGQLNSEQAKAALTFWLDMLQYAPPESTASTWDEVAETFAAGRAAQGWIYGENVAWIGTDSTRSEMVGKVGVALPPTTQGVIREANVGKGYIGYYDGGAFGIPHSSKHKEAALLWLQYIGQADVQPEWAAASARVVQLATFDDPIVQEEDKKVGGYFSLMKKEGRLFKGAPPFPFHPQIRDLIAPYLYQAIDGKLTPGEALDQAAMAVDEELIELGYGK